jgi:hypothetical protein
MIITTTVKPFYGTTTRGSGLNRLINELPAASHGELNFTDFVRKPSGLSANRNPEDAGRRRANKDTIGVKIRHRGTEGEICEFKTKH